MSGCSGPSSRRLISRRLAEERLGLDVLAQVVLNNAEKVHAPQGAGSFVAHSTRRLMLRACSASAVRLAGLCPRHHRST